MSRALGRCGRCRHHGNDLPRSVCRDRRPFRPRLRGRQRPPLRVRRNATGRGRSRTRIRQGAAYRRIAAAGSDDRIPRRSGQHGAPTQRRLGHRAVRGNSTVRPADHGAARSGPRAGTPTGARSTPMRAGRRSLSTGSSTAPAMSGRAAARPAPTPIRKAPTRRGSSCASFSSTAIPKPGEVSSLRQHPG